MKIKLLTLLFCLLVLSSAQTECQESRLLELQTGQIVLSPNDLGSAGASKNYYESLSRGQFDSGDLLGYAFAIAGFQASCSQTFFSLVVDTVQFQNDNTKMKIVIDFRNPAADALTVWTKVKLSYLVVSSTRYETTVQPAYIWATNVHVQLTGDVTNNPVFQESIFGQTAYFGGCGLSYDSVNNNYAFGIRCDTTANNANDAQIAHDVAVHAYIMGFQYSPDSTTTGNTMAASIKFAGLSNSMNAGTGWELAYKDGTDERYGISQKYGVQITYATLPTKNGPLFTISYYSGQLKSIKIGIVLTTVNWKSSGNPLGNGIGSTASYSYSGVYTAVDTANYNIETSLVPGGSNYNNLHENLPIEKYIIYGFSSFELLKTSKCSSFSLDLDIDTANSYLLNLNNAAYVNNVVFQADLYLPALISLCNPSIVFSQIDTVTNALANARANTYPNIVYLQQRLYESYSTVPSSNLYQNVQQDAINPLDWTFTVSGVTNDTTNVRLNAQVAMSGVTDGKSYAVRIRFVPTSTNGWDVTNVTHQFTVKVNGNTLWNQNFLYSQLGTATANKYYGINLKGSSALFDYTLIIPRSNVLTHDYKYQISIDFFELEQVYDPVTQCCVSQCPAQTGLDITVAPATCMKCDTSKGLNYDASSGSCGCKSGYYLDTVLSSQCFPCRASLCDTCTAATNAKCATCVSGASLSTLDGICRCVSGYYQNNNTCSACPSKCATCSVGTSCDTCSDKNRDSTKNCSCVAGYYDSGVSQCQTCNPSCATCSSSTTCTSCDARKFRAIRDGVCVCQDKFYQLIYQDGTRQCKPCSAECGNCSQSATQCSSCDATVNRVQGYDSLGHRTCLCQPGYHALADSSCVQSDCNADKWCSQCQKDLSLCIQCRASVNRVIKLPEHICICADGFYENSTGDCAPCAAGCAKCSSLTKCDSCVALATNSNNGTCACAVGTFYTQSSNGVRYCAKCISYCDSCTNALTCTTCSNAFTLAADNTCSCSKRNFINNQTQCVPCKSGCQVCTSNLTCSKCVSPLFVQNNSCVTQCSDGFYAAGSVCTGCPTNCVRCTSTNQCYYCQDNFYLHEGSCYSVCPTGTIANNNTFQCVACNSPCRTCANHPSTCTSCAPGQGYLQITAANQSCVKECAQGTYPLNYVCQVCDFKCARCLGSATNCIACPVGRYLYNGACWDSCPGIVANGSCVNSCPDGYYKFSDQECRQCSTQCSTCSSNTTCLTCSQNLLSKNGSCVTSCGDGYYEFRGLCVACDKSCNTCKSIPTQCVDCAKGYVKSGSKCVSSCADGTYLDVASSRCLACTSSCKTCTAEKLCLTCQNDKIVPVGGQCLSCIYPCDTCSSDLSTCNSCLSGYYLSAGQCIRTCPTGTRPVNGACTCASGIFLNGNCVTSCPSGYTSVNGTCIQCQSPCTSCSGSATFCTDCLETYTLKPNNGTCAQSSNCNYGQAENNAKCERICSSGFYYQNGACIFGGCPDGYKDNGFGGCVVATVNTGRCESPTFKLSNACVTNCGNAFFPNSNTRTCDACASNCQNCLNNIYCLTCATGFTSINGKCTAQSSCSATQFSYNGACVSSCPVGTFTNNGACIRSCQSGTYYFGNVCYSTCPTEAPYLTDNACVATCPTGTSLVDGVCATVV